MQTWIIKSILVRIHFSSNPGLGESIFSDPVVGKKALLDKELASTVETSGPNQFQFTACPFVSNFLLGPPPLFLRSKSPGQSADPDAKM
jgi:hypothetical protein